MTNDILARIIADETELEDDLLDNMPISVSNTTLPWLNIKKKTIGKS